MNIKGEKVVLRGIEPEDLEAIRQMTNDTEQEYLIGGWSLPTTKKHQEDWYLRILGDKQNNRFAIELDGVFVGLVNLTDIDWKNRCAETSIRLTKEAPRHEGIATDALTTLIRYAFKELNLHRVYATILENNIISQKLHEKCGYQIEGVEREAVYKNGTYHNRYLMALLKKDIEDNK